MSEHTAPNDDMPTEIDFSKGACGKFFHSGAKLIPFPVHSYREDEPQTVQVVRQGEVDKGMDELEME
ncbi:MAG: hypothetical protein LBM17_05545 [Candidatus Accumulibacter sp.]|jgi:hypothetical protein|nr:hypothetical protein [Accumulibacter sp.]